MTLFQQYFMHYLPRERGGGGGGLGRVSLRISFSKSNPITFYGSTEIRDQLETQEERSQLTLFQQNFYTLFAYMGGGGL